MAVIAWTRKAGVQCVQPPVEVMSRILAVRLHLDDCYATNGALRILPGSHRSDTLTTDRIEQISSQVSEVICEVPAGGAVLISPLLLHASSPMSSPGRRRVIHLEFTAKNCLSLWSGDIDPVQARMKPSEKPVGTLTQFVPGPGLVVVDQRS